MKSNQKSFSVFYWHTKIWNIIQYKSGTMKRLHTLMHILLTLMYPLPKSIVSIQQDNEKEVFALTMIVVASLHLTEDITKRCKLLNEIFQLLNENLSCEMFIVYFWDDEGGKAYYVMLVGRYDLHIIMACYYGTQSASRKDITIYQFIWIFEENSLMLVHAGTIPICSTTFMNILNVFTFLNYVGNT